jgi:hypothetical protein
VRFIPDNGVPEKHEPFACARPCNTACFKNFQMLRDPLLPKEYFDKGIAFKQMAIDEDKLRIHTLARPDGRAGCASDMHHESVKLLIQRYSRGDALPEMAPSVIQTFELLAGKRATQASVALEKEVRQMYERLDLSTLYDELTQYCSFKLKNQNKITTLPSKLVSNFSLNEQY